MWTTLWTTLLLACTIRETKPEGTDSGLLDTDTGDTGDTDTGDTDTGDTDTGDTDTGDTDTGDTGIDTGGEITECTGVYGLALYPLGEGRQLLLESWADAPMGSAGGEVTVRFRLSNPTDTSLEIGWDNCGYPRYSLLDSRGEAVWTGSPSDTMRCPAPGHTSLPAGESASWEWSIPLPATAGEYTLQTTAGLTIEGSGSPVDAYTYNLSSPLQVTEAESCARAGVEALFPGELRMSLANEGGRAPVGAVGVEGGGVLEGADALPGPWGMCGFPEFVLLDDGGSTRWRYSTGDLVDCIERTEWAAGTSQIDSTVLPADTLRVGVTDVLWVRFYRLDSDSLSGASQLAVGYPLHGLE